MTRLFLVTVFYPTPLPPLGQAEVPVLGRLSENVYKLSHFLFNSSQTPAFYDLKNEPFFVNYQIFDISLLLMTSWRQSRVFSSCVTFIYMCRNVARPCQHGSFSRTDLPLAANMVPMLMMAPMMALMMMPMMMPVMMPVVMLVMMPVMMPMNSHVSARKVAATIECLRPPSSFAHILYRRLRNYFRDQFLPPTASLMTSFHMRREFSESRFLSSSSSSSSSVHAIKLITRA